MKLRKPYLLLVLLFLLHHDFWYWNDPALVLGFLPVGLAYHAVYCLLTSFLWWFLLRRAWPDEIEAFANGDSNEVRPE